MLDALLQATHRAALVDAHLPYGETRRILRLRYVTCAIPVVLLVERAESGVSRCRRRGTVIGCWSNPIGLVELQRCLEKLFRANR